MQMLQMFNFKSIFSLSTYVIYSFFLFSSAFSVGYADIEDHFKLVGPKKGNHSMENIDFIYMLNLDRRPEKFQMSLDQLLPYGINPYRFSGIYGWELPLETIIDIGVQFAPGMIEGIMGTTYTLDSDGNCVRIDEMIEEYGKTYFCHGTSKGCIGIALSHYSILQDAYDSGYETIWIMEDDIEVLRDPTVLSKLIEQLDSEVGKTWDVLFTDYDIRGPDGQYVPSYGHAVRPNFFATDLDCFYQRPNVGEHFRKIGSRFGAHSMIFRRSGIAKMLNFIKSHNMFLPYDLEYYLPRNMQLYTVLNDVVGNLVNGLTDNGDPKDKKKVTE
jgi:GR25 family glycosyltransferase involved in LPS biosynthesis